MSHAGPFGAAVLAGSWALPSEGPLTVCGLCQPAGCQVLPFFPTGRWSGRSSVACPFLSSSSSSSSTRGYGWARRCQGAWLGGRDWARHGPRLVRSSPPHPHQELWAIDQLQVQEFMLSFLRDPLREIEEPYFFLDEVSPAFYSLEWGLPTRSPHGSQEPDSP